MTTPNHPNQLESRTMNDPRHIELQLNEVLEDTSLGYHPNQPIHDVLAARATARIADQLSDIEDHLHRTADAIEGIEHLLARGVT